MAAGPVGGENLFKFKNWLLEEEKCSSTIKKYLHDAGEYLKWAAENAALTENGSDKQAVHGWKFYLAEQGLRQVTINSMLAAVNVFYTFLGHPECHVKQFRIQRQTYCSEEKMLRKEEYLRLVKAAGDRGDLRLKMLLKTICGTGIRVSELPFITAEAVRRGEACVSLKGKTRVVMMPLLLKNELTVYCRQCGIRSGPVIRTGSGKALDRSEIWREMKALCADAGVEAEKVFPHNLRHLFARIFYGISKDIVKLADVLGHSSIDTTRIYIVSTGEEHRSLLERMDLVT